MSSSLWPHGPQHARPPCPSPTPGVYSNSCPLSRWCHPTISACHPFLLSHSIFPSIRVFSNESALHIRWPKYLNFSFNISLSNEHSGLMSFRMDWLDLLAVQGTLKSLLQYHSSKASILQCSTFFIVQLSHPYMTTGKTKALTRWTFVGKIMFLLFNMLSRLIITFLPRSKHFMANRWGSNGNSDRLFSWAPKSLQPLAPCKKSYGQPRQHSTKQRHYFADKGPSSQSFGFPRSHVWMWDLDHKECWALKNWCFWIVVLKKTLESPLRLQRDPTSPS